MVKREDLNTYLPGLEPEPQPGKNGKKLTENDPGSAELEVPRELEESLDERKWREDQQYFGKWKNSVHFGDNNFTLAQMPDNTVDMILTDPPYTIGYRSNRRVKNPQFKHLKNDQNKDWIPEFAKEAYRVLKENRHLYCFCRHDTYPEFITAFQSAGFKMKRTLIWVKNNHGSGDLKGDYAPQDEWIIYAHKGRRVLFGKRESNVLTQFPRLASKKLTHSTEKPVELLKFLIGKSTKKGELVLDPYAGSGSTMHAAIEMERDYCLIEVSPNYFLTSKNRETDLKQESFVNELYNIKR